MKGVRFELLRGADGYVAIFRLDFKVLLAGAFGKKKFDDSSVAGAGGPDEGIPFLLGVF